MHKACIRMSNNNCPQVILPQGNIVILMPILATKRCLAWLWVVVVASPAEVSFLLNNGGDISANIVETENSYWLALGTPCELWSTDPVGFMHKGSVRGLSHSLGGSACGDSMTPLPTFCKIWNPLALRRYIMVSFAKFFRSVSWSPSDAYQGQIVYLDL